MNTEETNVDAPLKEGGGPEDPHPGTGPDPGPDGGPDPGSGPGPRPDADATEADVSEADLDQEEQERLPMTGGGGGGGEDRAAEPLSSGGEAEKNGSVKLKVPEEEEEAGAVKFTGLSKEELLRVAGTPGWVRARWALLVVFWLGWLGMLAGAVLIILRAPPCRDLPKTRWWNDGPLYQVNVNAFSPTHNLKGVEQRLDSLSDLKVKGLILSPIHVSPPDDPLGLSFTQISPDLGNMDQLKSLIRAAHKKGIAVVLDLTPNYQGSTGPWFSNSSITTVAERLKSALVLYLSEGVDGVQFSGVDLVSNVVPSLWTDVRSIVQNGTDKHPERRVLIGVTELSSAEDVSALLSSSGVDLLLSRVLSLSSERAQSVQHLYSSHSQQELAWSLGGQGQGHLATLVGPDLLRLYQMMLLVLPGTPVFYYGDEIGLVDQGTEVPKMIWDWEEAEPNGTQQEDSAERLSSRSFFRSLSGLRVKERSLKFGDLVLLSNSSSSLAFLRVWDQSPRYVAAFNWGPEEEEVRLQGEAEGAGALPKEAAVVLTTNSTLLPADSSVKLKAFRLGPGQAALLKFPYGG